MASTHAQAWKVWFPTRGLGKQPISKLSPPFQLPLSHLTLSSNSPRQLLLLTKPHFQLQLSKHSHTLVKDLQLVMVLVWLQNSLTGSNSRLLL